MLALTFFSMACATFVLGYLLGKRARSPLTLAKVQGAVQFRVAVHEAGHAVVGHHSPHITIRAVAISEGLSLGEGRTSSAAPLSAREDVSCMWWDVAYGLGGLAGELLETKKARSGNCRDDLQRALVLVRSIAASSVNPEPPWSPVATDTGSFEPHRSLSGLSTEEARVMRLCYAHARAVLLREREGFNRLTHLLLERGTLDEAAIKVVLG